MYEIQGMRSDYCCFAKQDIMMLDLLFGALLLLRMMGEIITKLGDLKGDRNK